jgi:uncharacterized small protein (DUF1192 family)
MDWDDVHPRPKKLVTVGEDLKGLGIGELEARIEALEAEIARTKAEVVSKKKISAAASAVFKS